MVFILGGKRSPFSSTSSSSRVIDGEMPALANTWSIFPNSFSAALNISSWFFQDVTSVLKKGTEEASGSGRGFRSLANTLPPCWITRRKVASPMPDDAPIELN